MRVVVLALPNAQSLDVVGPLEVFDTAARVVAARGGERPYEVAIVAPGGGFVRSSSGLALGADPLPRGAVDTIVVAGGAGVRHAGGDDPGIAWLRRAAPRARRVTSVCTGAFALAAAGLLDGRSATTHWAYRAALARDFPAVRVDPDDPIYVRDGGVWTSAGVTAGMDLALALVEDDLGSEVALEVARWLVVFLKRPGGQAQFSAGLAAQTAVAAAAAGREPLRELGAWMNDHLSADLSVGALAARACLSERQFTRAWRAETGQTPAAYVETLRVERARALLEDGVAVDTAARESGFASAEVLRRVFHRRLGVAPSAYRERFSRAA
ncbi:MAG TPA: DJ-1/PfpI family protein [Baekduia sp.]|uniref:GlxA family transcriptional regulator n=1 Tax=Baekduia sp. TaxID=2600305 RepID=UPI002D79F92D|nr:DJ-1/PfpI family protein [Baekduia sp.]HET6509758.1 DJ-1/PfpI family protein [Baekduia sp.]